MSTPRRSRPRADPRVLVLLLGLVVARGAPAANAVDVEVTAKVVSGERPKVTLHVHQDLASAELALDASGPGAPAGKVRVDGGPSKAGRDVVLVLPALTKSGTVRFSGTLAVRFTDGSAGTMPLAFGVDVRDTLRIEAPADRVELAARRLVVRLSRPAARVDVEVTGDDGVLLANQSTTFAGEAPGTDLVVSWTPKSDATVLKIALTGHDTDGFYSPTLVLHPWSLVIPHDEIVFESGKSDIRPEEESKLTAILPDVERAIARYGKVVPVKLFVAGHTDTVGGPSTNQALSLARAMAIATWFRRHGVKVPIAARGFGESMPKVDTPDETDSEANRRADYVLAVESPTGSLDGWSKIP